MEIRCACCGDTDGPFATTADGYRCEGCQPPGRPAEDRQNDAPNP